MKASLSKLSFLSKRRLFWLFHISGWVFVTLVIFAYYGSGLETPAQYLRFLSYYVGGFLVTLALRRWLGKIATSDYSVIKLLLIVFFVAVGSTIVIYLIHFLVNLIRKSIRK